MRRIGLDEIPASCLADLIARRPADDLLVVLQRGADAGDAWCVSVRDDLLARGGALSVRQREVLRRMRDAPARAPAASPITARQPLGTWKWIDVEALPPDDEAPP